MEDKPDGDRGREEGATGRHGNWNDSERMEVMVRVMSGTRLGMKERDQVHPGRSHR